MIWEQTEGDDSLLHHCRSPEDPPGVSTPPVSHTGLGVHLPGDMWSPPILQWTHLPPNSFYLGSLGFSSPR